MAGQGYRFNPLLKYGFQREQTAESSEGVDPGALNQKVDKFQGDGNSGMVLYVDKTGFVALRNIREITTAERNKLAALPSEIPSYGIDAVEVESGYLKTYQLYALVGGKKTYLPDKINIPKDLHIKSVDVVTVSDTNPLPGYANGKYLKYVFVTDTGDVEQLINVNDLFSYVLEPGEHVRIENDVVSAHSFVPQYDSVDKVLPHEMQFQYTGDTTEDGKWVKDFFYRKKLVSKPVEETHTHTMPANTQYIDILVSDWVKPQGRYYAIDDYKYINDFYDENGRSVDIQMSVYIDVDTNENYIARSYPEIGDKIFLNNSPYTQYTIDSMEITGAANGGYIMVNGRNLRWIGSQGGNPIKAYVNDSGDIIYSTEGWQVYDKIEKISTQWGDKYRSGDDLLFARSDTSPYKENPQYRVGKTANDESITINATIGALVYDWQQANVQPTADFSAIDSRLDDLAADSHKQNTDTQLKDGAVKVTDTEVSINKPLMAGRYGTNDGTKALTIGNGTSATDRSNATSIDLNGNIDTIGDVRTKTHSLNSSLQGKVCTFEQMMAEYVPGNGMTYMIIE